jgi:hypothetical protein
MCVTCLHQVTTVARPTIRYEDRPSNATRLSLKMVETSLEVIFAQMLEDGLWRKGEPIYTSQRNMDVRDIGNAYVFSYDLIGTLLEVFGSQPELFMPHVGKLER